MPKDTKPRPAAHTRPSSFLSLLTGWVQQGVESFFATQRVLVDVAMRQNAVAMKAMREGLSDPENSPLATLAELAVEGTSSFMEAQRILLNMAQQENEIVMEGVKERVGGSAPLSATTDLMRRSIDTFIRMQEEFLKITSKQTIAWLEDVKVGKGYDGAHLVEFARQGMEKFVEAQKKFLDVVAQETSKATSGRPETAKHIKKTDISKLARDASNAFIEAQKRLLDVIGQQMNVNLKAATKTIEMLAPTRLLPMANLTSDGVKNFVDAEKGFIASMMQPGERKVVNMGERRKRPAGRRAEKAQVAHAGA